MAAILEHWGLDGRISARSGLPVDLLGGVLTNPTTSLTQFFHPYLVPGQPIYLYGSQYPGGRIINYNAFAYPQYGQPGYGIEGDTPRNFARGFGASQIDLALNRMFPITERLRLQFRVEAFNLFNHPNFGQINYYLPSGPLQFGYATNTLNNRLGGLNSLYQSGGPRSLQLMLKLAF